MRSITVNEVDFHICGGVDPNTGLKACSGKCPYCYVDMVKKSNPVFKELSAIWRSGAV